MIIAAIENFIFFSTLAALVCFALALTMRHMTRKGKWSPDPYMIAYIYTAAIVVPPLIAAWITIASLLPKSWLGHDGFEAAHSTPSHNLHLFGELTSPLEPMLAYGMFCFVVGAVIFAVWSVLRGYLRVGNVIKRLDIQSVPPPTDGIMLVKHVGARYGFDIGLISSDYPFSFVWGFGRSKLVISSGLLHMLSDDELIGVLEHEAAHHKRRDNLFKSILTLVGYTSLGFPLSRLLLRWRAEQVEMICDEVAAVRTSAPLDIAEALIKLRRNTTVLPRHAPVSGFIPDTDQSFERRVQRIIQISDAPLTPARADALIRSGKGRISIILLVFVATLVVAETSAPLFIHQSIETLIRYLI